MAMKKKKIRDIEITELIILKCGSDWTATFTGTINREKDQKGNPVIRGTAVINEGKAWSVANSEEKLENNLDEICWMKIKMGLHEIKEVTTTLCETEFNLN